MVDELGNINKKNENSIIHVDEWKEFRSREFVKTFDLLLKRIKKKYKNNKKKVTSNWC